MIAATYLANPVICLPALRLAGLTVADYDEFLDGDGRGNVIDKSDLEFPMTPRWNFSTTLRFTLPYYNSIDLQADYAWKGRGYNDVNNSELIAQDSFGLLTLRLSKVMPENNLELAFFITNATDELYVTDGLDLSDQFGYAGTFLGPPRTFHGQITWRFGD